MHTPQGSPAGAGGNICLSDRRLEPVGGELPLTEHSREKSPFITPALQVHDERAGQLRLREYHCPFLSNYLSSSLLTWKPSAHPEFAPDSMPRNRISPRKVSAVNQCLSRCVR